MEEPKNTQPFLLAPFGKRVLNWFIDLMIIIFIWAFLVSMANAAADNYGIDFIKLGPPVPGNYKVSGLIYVIIVSYYGLFESFLQRTPGKFVTGTKVIRFDGTKPNEWNILLRSVLRIIPFEPLSFLGPVPFGLHDSLSKTFVVRVGKMPAGFNDDINKQ